MKTALFVQARMGSARLPGKVLMQVLGKPLLEYQLERLKKVTQADMLAVLTSRLAQDDPIQNLCSKLNVSCFRGSENDVLDRYYQAALLMKTDLIVRITGDCPLIDPAITDLVIQTAKNGFPQIAYTSNSLLRTYPRGMDTEVITFNALQELQGRAKDAAEREHVTLYAYRHPEQFTLQNVSNAQDQSHYRLTVDTQEDFQLIQHILTELYPKKPDFNLSDIIALLESHPEWAQLNAHIKQKKI